MMLIKRMIKLTIVVITGCEMGDKKTRGNFVNSSASS